jgi:hypothetical protein
MVHAQAVLRGNSGQLRVFTGFFSLALPMLINWRMTNKSSFFAVIVTVFFAGIIAKMRAALDKQVPLGYEDENGFHLGVQPAKNSSDWPASW